MKKEYVRKVEGAYRVGKTRVSLDSLVYLFREGMSAESMVESYPALTLEQVHGALAFYLANQKEIDEYLVEGQRAAEGLTPAVQTNECRTDCEAPTGAQCEPNSRLTPISTAAFCAGCDGPRRKSISARRRMQPSKVWKIQKSC